MNMYPELRWGHARCIIGMAVVVGPINAMIVYLCTCRFSRVSQMQCIIMPHREA